MCVSHSVRVWCFFFFNDTATTEIYTLSLHDALPICKACFLHKRSRIDLQIRHCRSLRRQLPCRSRYLVGRFFPLHLQMCRRAFGGTGDSSTWTPSFAGSSPLAWDR